MYFFTGTVSTWFVFGTGAVDQIITAVALGHTPAVRGALDALLVTKPATFTSKQQLQHGGQRRTGRSLNQKSATHHQELNAEITSKLSMWITNRYTQLHVNVIRQKARTVLLTNAEDIIKHHLQSRTRNTYSTNYATYLPGLWSCRCHKRVVCCTQCVRRSALRRRAAVAEHRWHCCQSILNHLSWKNDKR